MIKRRAFLEKAKRSVSAVLGLSLLAVAGHHLGALRSVRFPAQRRSGNRPGQHGQGRQDLARLLRPPGALAEEAFLAACIECNRCQDSCDIGAILLFDSGEGKLANTPYVDPAVKGCDLCLKCTHICPTGALRPVAMADKGTVRMGTIEFHEDLCLSFKAKRLRDEQALLMDAGREPTEVEAAYERRGPCGECFMFCPLRTRAVRLEPGAFLAPVFDAEQCVGCGFCEEVCIAVTQGRPAIHINGIRSIA